MNQSGTQLSRDREKDKWSGGESKQNSKRRNSCVYQTIGRSNESWLGSQHSVPHARCQKGDPKARL